jgi:Na+/H+ antiporter NhaC
MPDYGVLCLVPTAAVLVLAVITRRPIESLLFGSVAGIVILHPHDVAGTLAQTSLKVMMEEDVAWVILVCGLMGSLLALLIRIGASHAFTERIISIVKGKSGALLCAWIMGILVFADDYLSSLAVGTAMRRITDRFRISREMLSFIVDSTAAPVSVIIPISTWGVFFGKLLENNGIAASGHGLHAYITSIPFMFYTWLTILIVPFVALNKFPLLGSMRAAEERAQSTGQTVPPEAERIETAHHSIREKEGAKSTVWHFVLPLASLVILTWWFDLDFLRSLYVTLGVTIALIVATGALTFHETFDTVIDGVKIMIEPLMIVVAAFILKDINADLGLSRYVIASVQPLMTAHLVPLLVFLTMGAISFATGSSWGIFVIALPIIVPLARGAGADMPLVIGATMSASTLGSHACFYSDSTVLSAQASGCTTMQHALTQLPYAAISAGLAALLFFLVPYFI